MKTFYIASGITVSSKPFHSIADAMGEATVSSEYTVITEYNENGKSLFKLYRSEEGIWSDKAVKAFYPADNCNKIY
jgi:hypothetical protein